MDKGVERLVVMEAGLVVVVRLRMVMLAGVVESLLVMLPNPHKERKKEGRHKDNDTTPIPATQSHRQRRQQQCTQPQVAHQQLTLRPLELQRFGGTGRMDARW